MIEFSHVSFTVRTTAGRLTVLNDMTGILVKGHYVLLAAEPQVRTSVVDLICGIRRPHAGKIIRYGRVSWPIGRIIPFRSALNGFETIEFFADIHGLDPTETLSFVRDICGFGRLLERSLTTWPGQASLNLTLSLALLPNFDIFVTDGSLIPADQAFLNRWKPSFQEKIRDRTIIVATSQISAVRAFCDRAIIADHGGLFMTDDIEGSLLHYPLQQVIEVQFDEGTDFE